MRPDLDAIRARCDKSPSTYGNELYLARRVPVLLDYIRELEEVLELGVRVAELRRDFSGGRGGR